MRKQPTNVNQTLIQAQCDGLPGGLGKDHGGRPGAQKRGGRAPGALGPPIPPVPSGWLSPCPARGPRAGGVSIEVCGNQVITEIRPHLKGNLILGDSWDF